MAKKGKVYPPDPPAPAPVPESAARAPVPEPYQEPKPAPVPPALSVAAAAVEIKRLEAEIVKAQARIFALQHPYVPFPKMVKGHTFNSQAELDAAGPEYA